MVLLPSWIITSIPVRRFAVLTTATGTDPPTVGTRNDARATVPAAGDGDSVGKTVAGYPIVVPGVPASTRTTSKTAVGGLAPGLMTVTKAVIRLTPSVTRTCVPGTSPEVVMSWSVTEVLTDGMTNVA